MSKPLAPDELWAIIAPLLPTERPKPNGGRPRHISDRAALTLGCSLIGWQALNRSSVSAPVLF